MPLPVHLVPLGIALDKVHAQQPLPVPGPGSGLQAIDEEFEKIDEARQKFVHRRISVKPAQRGSIKKWNSRKNVSLLPLKEPKPQAMIPPTWNINRNGNNVRISGPTLLCGFGHLMS